jgi:hypothetical protein
MPKCLNWKPLSCYYFIPWNNSVLELKTSEKERLDNNDQRHYFELKSSLDVFVLVMAHKKYIKGIDQRKTNDENDR